METTSDSKIPDLADSLLNFFVTQGYKECVGAMLFSCYELLRPDVVLEVAWRYGLQSFAMPYMIQTFRDYNDKLAQVTEKLSALDKAHQTDKEAEKKAKEEGMYMDPNVGNFNPMSTLLTLAPPPGNFGTSVVSYGAPPMAMGGQFYPAQPTQFYGN